MSNSSPPASPLVFYLCFYENLEVTPDGEYSYSSDRLSPLPEGIPLFPKILLESGLIPDRWFEAPMEDEAVSAFNMLQDMNLGIS